MTSRVHSNRQLQTESNRHRPELQALFEYVDRRDEDERGFRTSIVEMYEHNARWSNLIIRLIVDLLALTLRPRRRSIRYIFWGTKFSEIILGLPKNEVCVIGGPKQLWFCLKHRRKFLPYMRLWSHLAAHLVKENDNNLAEIEQEIEKIRLKFDHFTKQDAVMVIDNDSMPMQRAVVLAGREARALQTVCIQDGIFQSRSPGHVMHGWYSDQFLVINQHQKDMLIQKGMDASKIKVMGFHSSPYTPKRPTAPAGKRQVCFLGQPWTKYGLERANRYEYIVSIVADTLHASGLEMTYKPHPWEKESVHLTKINNVVDISLYDAFEKYDVFISLTSTALLEAQAAGRVGIQIMDNHFDADDFSCHGGIVSIDANQDEQWQVKLVSVLYSPVSASALRNTPSKRFTKALEARA